jgi:hypothetical protein
MGDMPDHTPSPPRFDLAAVALFGLSVFLGAVALKTLVIHIVGNYLSIGLSSVIQEFHLYRLALFSILPLCFNLAFGLYFGIVFRRCAARPRQAIPNLGALGFLAWYALFNLPAFLSGEWAPGHLWPSWPPSSLYLPVRNELLLFHLMGNLALLTGFCGAVSWGRMRHMLHAQQRR